MTLAYHWQLVAEKVLGSWGYGTLKLQLFAKLENQDIAKNKSTYTLYSRIWCDGYYCNSGNCYASIDGTNVKNNVNLSFPTNSYTDLGSKTIVVEHENNGKLSQTKSASFSCYALSGGEVSGRFELPQILRYSTIIDGQNFNSDGNIKFTYTNPTKSFAVRCKISVGSTSIAYANARFY